jgi:hypothetical protein
MRYLKFIEVTLVSLAIVSCATVYDLAPDAGNDEDTESSSDNSDDPDTATSADSDVDSDSDGDADSDSDSDSDNDSDSDSDSDGDSDGDSDTDLDPDTDSDTVTDPEIDTDTNTDPATDTDTDTDTDIDTNTDTDTATDTDTDIDTDTDTDTDIDTDVDADCSSTPFLDNTSDPDGYLTAIGALGKMGQTFVTGTTTLRAVGIVVKEEGSLGEHTFFLYNRSTATTVETWSVNVPGDGYDHLICLPLSNPIVSATQSYGIYIYPNAQTSDFNTIGLRVFGSDTYRDGTLKIFLDPFWVDGPDTQWGWYDSAFALF